LYLGGGANRKGNLEKKNVGEEREISLADVEGEERKRQCVRGRKKSWGAEEKRDYYPSLDEKKEGGNEPRAKRKDGALRIPGTTRNNRDSRGGGTAGRPNHSWNQRGRGERQKQNPFREKTIREGNCVIVHEGGT